MELEFHQRSFRHPQSSKYSAVRQLKTLFLMFLVLVGIAVTRSRTLALILRAGDEDSAEVSSRTRHNYDHRL